MLLKERVSKLESEVVLLKAQVQQLMGLKTRKIDIVKDWMIDHLRKIDGATTADLIEAGGKLGFGVMVINRARALLANEQRIGVVHDGRHRIWTVEE